MGGVRYIYIYIDRKQVPTLFDFGMSCSHISSIRHTFVWEWQFPSGPSFLFNRNAWMILSTNHFRANRSDQANWASAEQRMKKPTWHEKVTMVSCSHSLLNGADLKQIGNTSRIGWSILRGLRRQGASRMSPTPSTFAPTTTQRFICFS